MTTQTILNLTQHKASPEQKEAGVVDLEGEDLDLLKKLLTFDEIPDMEDLEDVSFKLVQLARSYDAEDVMIGGFLPLMSVLEFYLISAQIRPLFAFSKRMVEEDGQGNKKVQFKHKGFVESYGWFIRD